jgi:PAS domain S-box-containing protein
MGERMTPEQFRAIFDNLKDAVFIETPDGRILDANKAACDMLGYGRDELLSMRVSDIVPPERASHFSPRIRTKTVAHGVYVETEELCSNGRRIPVEVSNTLVKMAGRKWVIAILRDISERKAAEAALIRSKEECRKQSEALERKNAALREILDQIEMEKQRIREEFAANVEALLPVLKKLRLKGGSRKHLAVLENRLRDLTSPFSRRVSGASHKLAPREIEICGMIKGGLTSKEIARLLDIMPQTVERHRVNIRRKFGIAGKTINLTTYLRD